MKRACFVYPGRSKYKGAIELYRGNIPATMVNTYSWQWRVDWIFFEHLEHRAGELVRWLKQFDVLIFARYTIKQDSKIEDHANLFGLIRSLNIRIAYEIDDDATNEFRVLGDGDFMQGATALWRSPSMAVRRSKSPHRRA